MPSPRVHSFVLGLSPDDDIDQVTLVFHEQADGRKVARLPSGKVVLIAFEHLDKVKDGERWLVNLYHKDMFAIATPVDKIPLPPGQTPAPVVTPRPVAPAVARPAPTATLGTVATVRVESGGQLSASKPATAALGAATAMPASTVMEPRGAMVTVAPVAPSSVIKPTDTVAFFLDGANTDYSAREAGYFLDYAKAKKFFLGPGRPYAAFYFVADFTQTDPLQNRFLDYLSHNGFVVRKKPVKAIKDEETGETTYKSNVDVEMAVELLNTEGNYDVAFLFTGDSDFERVVDVLRSRGKRVYVVSARKSLSRELAYVADKPIFYLEDYRAALEREQKAAAP